LALSGPKGLAISVQGRKQPVVEVAPDATGTLRVYVTAPVDSKAAQGGITDIRFWIKDMTSGSRVSRNTVFHGTQE